jgi:integrase/recombinase XerD
MDRAGAMYIRALDQKINMRSSHTFAIDFIIRRSKGNRQRAIIYARITVDGVRTEISLKEQIDAADWMGKQERVNGKSKDVQACNRHIEDTRFRIRAGYRVLQEKSALITVETVKQAYLGVSIVKNGHTLLELLEYYRKIWSAKLKPGGFKNYKTTIAYLKLFMSSRLFAGDIHLSDLNRQVATEFEHYVRSYPVKAHDPCVGNGLAKHIQRFKRIVNWAVEIEWLQTHPFEKYNCPVKKAKRKKLTLQELVALERKGFADPVLQYVKELFLYCAYTGLAFVDVLALTPSDFEGDITGIVWCKIYRTKSDGLCPVPLLPSAADLLTKYRADARASGRKTIFPAITNQHVNNRLRIIQEVCGIDTPMTFHVARHTFAKTVALKNGVPLETIQMMMGHSKISTTQIYAEVDEEKIMNDMTGLEDKLDAKRRMIGALAETSGM